MRIFCTLLYLCCTSDTNLITFVPRRRNDGTQRHNKTRKGTISYTMSTNIRVQRICKYCGNEFTAKTTVTLYCGDVCSKRAYKARIRAAKVEATNTETKQIKAKSQIDLNLKSFLSITEACTLIGISRRTIYRMIQRGELVVGKAGKRTLIRRSDIDSLFELPHPIEEEHSKKPINNPVSLEDCYSLNSIKSKFGISEKALYDLIKRNDIQKIKNGIHTYVPKKAIDLILS